MTVYVDELKQWGPTDLRCFEHGSSHMTADTLEELHVMAEKIGLRRKWFQNHTVHPHYDLTPRKRVAALDAGAIFLTAREQAKIRLAARGLL